MYGKKYGYMFHVQLRAGELNQFSDQVRGKGQILFFVVSRPAVLLIKSLTQRMSGVLFM
jgi:hypothetical protein